MQPKGLYLYGMLRPGALETQTLEGVEPNTHIYECPLDRISAAISQVTLSDYERTSENEKFSDHSWLIPRAVHHESILEELMQESPILPAQFGTSFSSESHVTELLNQNYQQIDAFLSSMAGLEEWDIKIGLNPEKAEEELLVHDPDLAQQAKRLPTTPGRRYFFEKQLRNSARKQSRSWGRSIAEDLYRYLDGRVNKLQYRPLQKSTETASEPIAHLVALVPKEDRDRLFGELRSKVQNAGPIVIDLQTTGPWPPYHYCPVLGGHEVEM